MPDFSKKSVIPCFGSVTPDFQGVQIVFTHVIQFMLLQSRDTEKEKNMPIFTKSRVQCSDRVHHFFWSTEKTDFIIMLLPHPIRGSTYSFFILHQFVHFCEISSLNSHNNSSAPLWWHALFI